MDNVFYLFREYMGTGLIVIWYLIALIYLWVREKRKEIRVLFLYMPVFLLLLYFNPLFARLVYRMAEGEIYYRILWLLPVTAVIAYACVRAGGQIAARRASGESLFPGRSRLAGALFSLCAAAIIAVSGSFIYSSPLFSPAENLCHVPDSVIAICERINVPGREVMAVFPLELVQYVRQYSPVTCMPYGREMTVDRWNRYSPLVDAMEQEVIELERLVPLVREASCHYCILPGDRKIVGDPETYGWIRLGETHGYVIYRDPAMELVIPAPEQE